MLRMRACEHVVFRGKPGIAAAAAHFHIMLLAQADDSISAGVLFSCCAVAAVDERPMLVSCLLITSTHAVLPVLTTSLVICQC